MTDIVMEDYRFLQHHGHNGKGGDRIHIGWLLGCTVADAEKILINPPKDLAETILSHIEKRFEEVPLAPVKNWLLFFRDIEELAMIGAVTGKDTASAPPTEIIWDEGLKVERVPSGSSCDESFIGRGGVSTSLFFFDANWSLRDLFSSINFNRPEDRISISRPPLFVLIQA
ncbi:hypothetical protein RhiirB3_458573 [Rhizophagus irregularis]|nr:hypothetical protein RhiirB3_458573 [Rhizophagus irregularis]